MVKLVKQNTEKNTVFAELAKAGHTVNWLVEVDENNKITNWIALVWNHRIAFTHKFATNTGFKMPKEYQTKENTLKNTNIQIQYVIADGKSIGFRLKRDSDKKWSQLFVFESVIAEDINKK